MISPLRSRRALLAMTLSLAIVAGCDERFNPTIGGLRPPAIDVSDAAFGEYNLTAVDSTPLPHVTTRNGTPYTLAAGTFVFLADSTWLYSTVNQQPGIGGTVLSSVANYTGRWSVVDSTIIASGERGSMRISNDTIFWTGGPRHSWEDPYTAIFVHK